MKTLSASLLLIPVSVLLSLQDIYPNMEAMLLYYSYVSIVTLIVAIGILLLPNDDNPSEVSKGNIKPDRTMATRISLKSICESI